MGKVTRAARVRLIDALTDEAHAVLVAATGTTDVAGVDLVEVGALVAALRAADGSVAQIALRRSRVELVPTRERDELSLPRLLQLAGPLTGPYSQVIGSEGLLRALGVGILGGDERWSDAWALNAAVVAAMDEARPPPRSAP